MHYCDITDCKAMLLGFSYWTYKLDDGRVVHLCPVCSRKVNNLGH